MWACSSHLAEEKRLHIRMQTITAASGSKWCPIFPIPAAVRNLEHSKANTLPKLHKVRPIAGHDNPEEGVEV